MKHFRNSRNPCALIQLTNLLEPSSKLQLVEPVDCSAGSPVANHWPNIMSLYAYNFRVIARIKKCKINLQNLDVTIYLEHMRALRFGVSHHCTCAILLKFELSNQI